MKPLFTTQFTAKDVDIVAEKLLYHGYLKLLQYQIRHRLFNGNWSAVITRELLFNKAAVGVLLFDPIRDKIVMVEQFRVSMLQAEPTASPWLFEIIAGVMEADETVTAVAKREAQEEAGCELLDLIPMYEYLTNPGTSNGKFYLFCARINAKNAGGIFGLAEEHEDIKAHVLSKQQVYDALDEGQISNAPTLIAIQWLKLHETALKKRWHI